MLQPGEELPRYRREVRIALVMNGGVSLAAWIGGVTQEVDAVRRASERLWRDEPGGAAPPGTDALWQQLLGLLGDRVVVDVIGGASAGGVNGAVLAGAIAGGRPLPRLLGTWLDGGELAAMLRPEDDDEPRSVLDGDGTALVAYRDVIELALGDRAERAPDHPLLLTLTATDVHGERQTHADSTGQAFVERDHRRRFQFEWLPDDHLVDAERARSARGARAVRADDGEPVMPDVVDLRRNPDAAELLARAARATSSFPVAFEAHRMWVESGDGSRVVRWFIDGGVLDNQPFDPVLDRIRVAPADVAVRRVVMYVVPYLTPPPAPRTEPTARSVWSATGSLPRDLPRVNGIERLQRERREASAGLAALRRIRETSPDRLRAAARALFAAYRRTRRAAALQELAGRAGLSASAAGPAALDETLPWVPESLGWRSRDREWRWGVAVAERIVLGALAALRARLAEGRPGERDALVRARADVSMRAWRIRWLRTELREELRRAGGSADAHADVVALARGAYERLRLPGRLQEELRALEETLGECRRRLDAVTDLPRVVDLLAAEVVENAFAVRVSQVPVPFDFVHASAGVPSALGHERDTPESKLCGMELHHFAGFLKRSWRASDWLWGRLDGTHHLVRALVDAESLGRGDVPGLADRIAAFAFPEGDEGRALADAWRRTCGGAAGADPRRDLADRLARVQAGGDTGSALDACCLAIAARVQLAVLREDLVEVARAITVDLGAGAAGGTAGERWAELVAAAGPEPDGLALVGLFRRLDLAQAESVDEELGADLVRGTVQQAAGTAARLLLGAHGGVPVRLPGTVKSAVELMVERLAPGLLDEAD